MEPPRNFPFDPLPLREVTPRPGPGDMQANLQRDTRIIRWFIEKRWGRRMRPASSLGRLLEMSERVDLHGPSISVDELDQTVAQHALHLTSTLTRLAWAVRALHGRDSVDQVDGSFIDDELMGEDTSEPSIERRLPGGIGTIVFAGRLVQAGGGRILSINGKGGRGHDIRWRTEIGDKVLVERKDRSYEAGLEDTAEKRTQKVVAEVRKAASTIPQEPGVGRVLVVGFQHLVRKCEAEAVDKGYETGLKAALAGSASRRALPHVVIIEQTSRVRAQDTRREVEFLLASTAEPRTGLHAPDRATPGQGTGRRPVDGMPEQPPTAASRGVPPTLEVSARQRADPVRQPQRAPGLVNRMGVVRKGIRERASPLRWEREASHDFVRSKLARACPR